MSLMGTLAKVAIGYAAARGVDKMAGGQGLQGLFGGAQLPSGSAATQPAPGSEAIQSMMSQMTGGLGNLQNMMTEMAQKSGVDLSALMGGMDGSGSKGGLLSSMPTGGSGLAGMLAAMGGMAAMTGKGVGDMVDSMGPMASNPQTDQMAGLMLRAMIQAAKADGEIDATEQAKIMETVGDDADADDIAFVKEVLAAPVDPAALAADTPEGLQMQVYSMSLMSIRVDTDGEAQYLDSLAQALGLNQQQVNALHMQMGVKPLYA